MSIYLKVEFLGRYLRLLRLRGITNIVGLDKDGHLSTDSPLQPVVSLFHSGEKVLLRIERDGVALNGEVVAKELQRWVEREEVLEFDDYRILVAVTSSRSEVVATLPRHNPEVDYLKLLEEWNVPKATLSAEIINLSKSIPLFDGLEVSVGSSEKDDALLLKLEGVEPLHASFRYNRELKTVTARALCGAIEVAEKVLTHQEVQLAADTTVKILPVGVPLRVLFSV